MQLMASAAFGLEAVVGRELKALGMQDVRVDNARVFFTGGWEEVAKANLWLRTGNRVFIVVGTFPATTFDTLFEGVKALPWENFLPKNAQFPVSGRAVRSTLMSVSDCQAITKKAIAERLKAKYKLSWFPEDGQLYPIEVSMLQDMATLTLDTSGEGLHKRGYRTLNAEAPLRETMAAALLMLAGYRKDKPFWDPFCGSGTLPIEAAMMATNRAPGLGRAFGAEQWGNAAIWTQVREEAQDAFDPSVKAEIFGTDIDDEVLSLARYHMKNAGLEGIHFQRQAVIDMTTSRRNGMIVTNPPYGERLGERKEAERIYADMKVAFSALEGWEYHVITSHKEFERYFGRRADKKRKLFNGPLECTFYQYFARRDR